ncbi:MAG TPA: MFS transporter [Candidatus Saccharimonadales bacterium]|nr:MFS transporter [Candidatus Saccharimonadales bacterium]
MDKNRPENNLRTWLGLAVLALPTLVLAVETSVTYLALPYLSKDLNATGIEQLWIVDIYGFVLASLLITMGNLGDRIGRRKLLLIGAMFFAMASALAAFAPTVGLLIFARVLMGIAGATLMPSTLALISNLFTDKKQRSMAIGVWMSCFMVGMIIGPLLGGYFIEKFYWGSVFLLAIPPMITLLIAGPFLLPEFKTHKGKSTDLISVGLSLLTIMPLVFGLKNLAFQELGMYSLLGIVVGIIFGFTFVRRQKIIDHPLLDVSLFKNLTFSTVVFVMLVVAVLMGGTALLLNQYLQLVQGFSPLITGLWGVPQAVGMLFASIITPILAQRIRQETLIVVGLVIAALGFMLIFISPVGWFPLAIAGFVLATIGVAPTLVLGTGIILSAVSPEKSGSAAAISETSNQLGVALGVALIGSLAAVIFSNQISVPGGSGLDAISIINSSAQHDVIVAAQNAFAKSFSTVAAIGAAIFAGLAVLVHFIYKNKEK